MTAISEGPGRRLAPMSVMRAVAAFLVAGLVVLTVVGVLLAVAQKQQATDEAISDASVLTRIKAEDVVGPQALGAALQAGPGYAALDALVRERVLSDDVVRVKIWDETGRVVYSDDTSLVGRTFPLPEEELAALRTGDAVSEVSDLDEDENLGEADYDRLLQVYLGVRTDTGQQLLFETYQPYDTIQEASFRMWSGTLPVLVGGLLLLYVVQAPLAYRMARRLQSAQEEREQLLVGSLATADRERSRIASDLHDGVVQGLVGASYTLNAAASAARSAGDRPAADQMAGTAGDLRRWVRELRSLIVTVAPPALHRQGLGPSLRDLLSPLEARGIVVRLDLDGADDLPEVVEALAYRVAQEAVRNIVRHAGASTVEVSVRVAHSVLVLRVCDDGAGFDPGQATRQHGSVGLELLTSLAATQEGRLDVDAAPGAGTAVTLRVAVPQGARPHEPVVLGVAR